MQKNRWLVSKSCVNANLVKKTNANLAKFQKGKKGNVKKKALKTHIRAPRLRMLLPLPLLRHASDNKTIQGVPEQDATMKMQ